MPLITWNESLSVLVPPMDQEHECLVTRINALHEAMSEGQGKTHVADAIDDLVSYIQTHVSSEEAFMEKMQYPMLFFHRQKHAEIVKAVTDLKARVERGETVAASEVMGFLRNWLVNHIGNVDRKYGEFAAQLKPSLKA